jgi:transcriptional regulator with XRE-family HTH domain
MATLVLRGDNLNKYRRLAGLHTDASLARRIGVDPTTVYRVLNGRTVPSARFIAGIVEAFGADLFSDLFEVIPDEPRAQKDNEPAGAANAGRAQ